MLVLDAMQITVRIANGFAQAAHAAERQPRAARSRSGRSEERN
jgi:hypothetical protein